MPLLDIMVVANLPLQWLKPNSLEPEVDRTPNEDKPKSNFSFITPILVYDGECDFCKFWVSRWQRTTSNLVEYTPFQKLPREFYGITKHEFRSSVYLITQYRRLKGAAAVFEVLAYGGNDLWNRLYYNVVLADVVFEAGYRLVATHRNFFYRLTKLFFQEAREFKTGA